MVHSIDNQQSQMYLQTQSVQQLDYKMNGSERRKDKEVNNSNVQQGQQHNQIEDRYSNNAIKEKNVEKEHKQPSSGPAFKDMINYQAVNVWKEFTQNIKLQDQVTEVQLEQQAISTFSQTATELKKQIESPVSTTKDTEKLLETMGDQLKNVFDYSKDDNLKEKLIEAAEELYKKLPHGSDFTSFLSKFWKDAIGNWPKNEGSTGEGASDVNPPSSGGDSDGSPNVNPPSGGGGSDGSTDSGSNVGDAPIGDGSPNVNPPSSGGGSDGSTDSGSNVGDAPIGDGSPNIKPPSGGGGSGGSNSDKTAPSIIDNEILGELNKRLEQLEKNLNRLKQKFNNQKESSFYYYNHQEIHQNVTIINQRMRINPWEYWASMFRLDNNRHSIVSMLLR